MKKAKETQWMRSGWRRVIAFMLVFSMLLIPVRFPSKAIASENGEVTVPNVFTDSFSDDRHTGGLTYKWNNQGGTNTYYSVGDGYFTLGMPYSEEEGGAYHTISILGAMGKDSAGSSKDYAGDWTNYTAQIKFSKAPVGTTVTYDNGTVKTTTVLNTIKLLTRVSLMEKGYEYYFLQITGRAGESTGTLSLQRHYYDTVQGKFVDEILSNFGGKTMTEGTWHSMQVKLEGNSITVCYDGEELGTVADNSEFAIASGSVGLSSTGRGGLQYVDDVLVTFPNDQTAFYDSFADDRFQQGVTYGWNPGAEVSYQWQEAMANVNSYAMISEEGTYQIFPQRSSSVYLAATCFDPATGSAGENGAFWTNYTVEGDVKRNNTTASNGAYLLGRVQYDTEHNGYRYYALKVHSTSIYLIKRYYDTTQSKWVEMPYGSISGTAGVGNWGHAKMTFNGAEITISLTYSVDGVEKTVSKTFDDSNGSYTTTVTTTDETTGESVKKQVEVATCAPFMYGGIGLRGDYTDATTEDNAEFDNIKVTLENGAVVFSEDFSAYTAGTDTYKSEGYFAGVLEEYDPNKVQPWDVEWTLEEAFSGGSSEITEEGTYKFYADGTGKLVVKGTLLHPSDAEKNEDASTMLTDYTVEFDYVRHNMKNATTQGGGAPWFVYNMSEDSNTYPYLGNTLKLHSSSIYLFNQYRFSKYFVYQSAADRSPDGYKLGEAGSSAAAGNWRHAKLEISGLQYTITVTDLAGNSIGSGTYTAKENNPGYFGFMFESGSNDTYVDEALGYERSYEIDNLKVTMPNGKVAFEETFTLAEGETKDTYMAATRTVEDVYYPEEAKDWNVSEGAYEFGGANYVSINTVTVTGNKVDTAREWTDYAIESDFLLGADQAAAGFVARYTGVGSYYQMVITASGAGLYKVSGKTVTALATEEIAIAKDAWHFAKLTVEGTKLKGYLNGTEILSADVSADADRYESGTVGLLASSAVQYDNFAVYSAKLSDSRKYGTYTFKETTVSALTPNWSIGTGWDVANDKLVYTNTEDASVAGKSMLKSKFIVGNYYAEASVTTAESGKVGVIGRASLDGLSYYSLTLDMENGLVLSKSVDGSETVVDSVSVLALYMQGIQIKKNTGYVLRLYMHGDVIQGYINGRRVIACVDDAALTSGVTGVVGTNGVAIVSLVTAVAEEPPVLSIVDAAGTEITAENPFVVNPGKVPEIINLYLKLTSGENEKLLPLDAVLEQTGLVEKDLVTDGTVSAIPVTYDGAGVNFYYQYVARTEEIAALDAQIAVLAAADALTLDDAATVEDLIDRYNDLSIEERAGITEENQEKLAAAKEAILVLKYGADVLGEVVFLDTFDSAENESLYTSDYDITGVRNEGKWFVRNGVMYDYHIEDIGKPTSYFAANALIRKDYEVSSVSVDVQFIEEKAWAGIRFNIRDKGYYEFRVTDKSHRLYLIKNGTATLTDTNTLSTDFRFEVGKWYNLRVTISETGLIKCYLDDTCWLTYQDTPNVLNDTVLTHGTVALVNCENWAKYDNLEIRGVEHEYVPEIIVQTNPNLPATSWSDNFQEETAGSDPSHWVDIDPENKWLVKADGDNLLYGSAGYTAEPSETWLHVFETNVAYTAKLRATAMGEYPIMGLTARVNAAKSYIRAGYDFTIDKWFIKVRLGADFEEEVTYSSDSVTLTADANTWYTLKLKAVEEQLELYVGETLVVSADAGTKVMPGRVGVFAEQCDVDIDDVDLQLLSGQGRVNDGVLEYYPTEVGAGSSMYSHFTLADGRIMLHSDGNQYISSDDGATWEKTTLLSSNGFGGGTVLKLRNGNYLNVKGVAGKYAVLLSTDGGLTWKSVGAIDYDETKETYAQPGEHLSEVVLNEGTENEIHRIFYTIGNQTKGQTDGVLDRSVISDVFYSDDYGATWTKAANSPMYTTNLKYFCETHILKITKDVTDALGNVIPAGTLIHYSTYNSSDCMRYNLSYDGGVTWEGDYAMPEIPCGLHSMTIEEDPNNPGTYYMATVYNPPRARQYGFPRHRMALLRSTDGFNWEYLCDVDRWGDISGPSKSDLMQNVNMYLSVSDDYVWVSFGRADQYSDNGSHNLVIGRLYRFEKTKLQAYESWPQEYIIPDKAILGIEAVPTVTEYEVGSEFDITGNKIKVYYYDGTTEEVDMADAFVTTPEMTAVGEKSVTVDYKQFRTIYTVNVVEEEPEVPEEPIDVTVNNVGQSNSGATVKAPEKGWNKGQNTFEVTSEKVCYVVVSYDGGQTYQRLEATVSADGYSFTAENMDAGTKVAVLVAGDNDGSGKLSITDVIRARAELLGKGEELDALQQLATDLNGDSRISITDIILMRGAMLEKIELDW